MGYVRHKLGARREALKPFSPSYDVHVQYPPNAVLTEAWYGLRGNTLGDTDMDDHRSCGFLLSAIPFILIPPLKKKKKQLVVDYFRILFFWIIFVGWVWRGGEQLGAEGERQHSVSPRRPQSPCCRQKWRSRRKAECERCPRDGPLLQRIMIVI
jgi:hypothetical protein